jgi:hypothetical protein
LAHYMSWIPTPSKSHCDYSSLDQQATAATATPDSDFFVQQRSQRDSTTKV